MRISLARLIVCAVPFCLAAGSVDACSNPKIPAENVNNVWYCKSDSDTKRSRSVSISMPTGKDFRPYGAAKVCVVIPFVWNPSILDNDAGGSRSYAVIETHLLLSAGISCDCMGYFCDSRFALILHIIDQPWIKEPCHTDDPARSA